ncbi:hypothetical protein [Rheinheimera sp. WS51]|uniref:hypothetical protein n=1 Tax=Rheinheimera sp. WS51 TaxID=3425886 RepID=UPI003D9165BC
MSAVKLSHIQQQRFFFQQKKHSDLSEQEHLALNHAWATQDADEPLLSYQEIATAHCAELGYN